MEKMMKISKNLNTFANVARQIFKAAAIVIAVCVVIALFVKEAIWLDGTYSLQLGNVNLELIPDGAVPAEVTRVRIIGGLALCVPVLLVWSKCLGIVQDILKPMTLGKPFDSNVSASLRKLSLYALIVGAIAEIGGTILSALQLNSVKLSALFNDQFVAGYTVEHVLDTNFIYLFAALYLMSHVFRYGEELQQLSDETL